MTQEFIFYCFIEYKSFSNDSLVVEARRMAPLFPAANRNTVEQLCDEISELAQTLENCQDAEVLSNNYRWTKGFYNFLRNFYQGYFSLDQGKYILHSNLIKISIEMSLKQIFFFFSHVYCY